MAILQAKGFMDEGKHEPALMQALRANTNFALRVTRWRESAGSDGGPLETRLA